MAASLKYLKTSGRRTGNQPNAIDVDIGKRIRLRRISLGITQERLAVEIGVAFQQVQKYEGAANRITASRLCAVAQALRCPVSFFYQGTGQPSGVGLARAQGDAAPIPAGAAPHEVMASETFRLVRAYHGIKDRRMRRKIIELAASLGKFPECVV